MTGIKCILFDCMETLIDLTKLPNLKDYALWAFEGSGCEHYWRSFDDFYLSYVKAKDYIAKSLPEHKEYNILERFKYIAGERLNNYDIEEIGKNAEKIYNNYWQNYKSKCYVRDEVKEVLPYLSDKYKLGVVSNFMVTEGIEELLKENDILGYFDFVITSVKEGWRKPHPSIYKSALTSSNYLSEEILFIGDDFTCDYEGPRKIGLKTLLLDRENKYCNVNDRVCNFLKLKEIL